MSFPGMPSIPAQADPNGAPWWLRYAARGAGCGGGIIAIGLGAFNCVTIFPICIVAGIWQMLAGFVVISAEAPFCCMFIDFVQQYSHWVEGRPPFQKAILYILISLPALFMCFGLTTLFGSGLIFLTGVLYGMIALGKKGNREDMMATAQATSPGSNMKENFADMEVGVGPNP